MTHAVDRREVMTLQPGDAPTAVKEVSEALAAGRPVRLTGAIAAVVKQIVTALARGQAVDVALPETSLTTQEAADLLQVSHQALVGLLEDGMIPSERLGDHRRVRLTDVLVFAHQRQRRRQALDEIVEESRKAGLYDLPDSDYLDALREVREKR